MKCRNGPIEKRNCSIDFFCSFFYLGVIALVVIYGFSVPTNPTNVSEL